MRRRKQERSKAFWASMDMFIRERKLNCREKAPLGDRCKSTAGKGAIFECRSIAN
jgi:hypothetical protein